jgi:hypothetical protein
MFESEVDEALTPDTDPAETEIQGWKKEEDLGILQYLDRLEAVTETYIIRCVSCSSFVIFCD